MNSSLEHPPQAGNIIMVAAPSGAGKSTLVGELLQLDPTLRLSISCTTRPPRPGEINGREYHFISRAEFERLQQDNDLLEWARVHDNFYGTPKRWIADAVAEGQDVILEIDWQGARQVRQHFPAAVGVFIVPPSIEELEKRLRTRGQDDLQVIARRLLAAGSEIAHAPEFEYVIINQDFSTALSELAGIVKACRLRYVSQAARHAELFSQLGIHP